MTNAWMDIGSGPITPSVRYQTLRSVSDVHLFVIVSLLAGVVIGKVMP
jgi:hypothetical protein